MAKRQSANRGARRANGPRNEERPGALEDLAKANARIVRQAASILEQEVAAGILAAKQFTEDFRQSINEAATVSGRPATPAVNRLRRDAHDAVDTLMNLVEIASKYVIEAAAPGPAAPRSRARAKGSRR